MHVIPVLRQRVLRSTLTLAVVAGAGLIVPTVAAASSATVTRATLPSFFVDRAGTIFPATCDITQVVNDNQRIETFRCTFDDAVTSTYRCDDSCTWSSDFDGAPAVKTYFHITPSGLMLGWAVY